METTIHAVRLRAHLRFHYEPANEDWAFLDMATQGDYAGGEMIVRVSILMFQSHRTHDIK